MLDALFRIVGFGLCHQLSERSFAAGGYQLPVCARDTGIYVGFALSLLVIALIERGRTPSEVPRVPWLIAGAVFLGAMAYDGVTSYAGLRTTTNDLRLITGLLAGYALPLLVVPMLNSQMWRGLSGVRLFEGARGWPWLASLPLAFASVRWLLPLTGVLYPILTTIAIIVTFLAVNLVFATLLPTFERRADTLRGAWRQLLLSAALTFGELAAAAGLRLLVERLA
ncbi:MAG: DUF2085 domain-containing protein [Coriobacteriia bacterium]